MAEVVQDPRKWADRTTPSVPSSQAVDGPLRPPVDAVRRAGDILAVVVLGACLAVIGGGLLALYVAVVVDALQ